MALEAHALEAESEIRCERARLLGRAIRYEEALDECELVCHRDPMNARATMLRGTVLMALQRWSEAHEILLKAQSMHSVQDSQGENNTSAEDVDLSTATSSSEMKRINKLLALVASKL